MLKRCSQEKETVARLLNTSGHYAPRFHDQEVHDLTPRAIQCDEQGSFVKKKQKHRNDDEARQAGDFWDHTAIAPDSKLMVSLDGNPNYLPAIVAHFGHWVQLPRRPTRGPARYRYGGKSSS
jgi:hypothetical protein